MIPFCNKITLFQAVWAGSYPAAWSRRASVPPVRPPRNSCVSAPGWCAVPIRSPIVSAPVSVPVGAECIKLWCVTTWRLAAALA